MKHRMYLHSCLTKVLYIYLGTITERGGVLCRYVAIVRPMVYGDLVTAARSTAAASAAWILAALVAVLPMLGLAR